MCPVSPSSCPKALGGHWVSLGTWHPPACARGCGGGGAAVVGTPRGCTRPSSQDYSRAISLLLTPGVHSWEQGDFPREASGFLAETWNTPGHQTNPVSPPQGQRLCAKEPSQHRLRGSHISFNSNIRVLNIQRARGEGGIYSASKYTASTDRDKLKTAREEKILLAPPQAHRVGGWGSRNAKRRRCFHRMPPGAGFSQEKKGVLSDVKLVTK